MTTPIHFLVVLLGALCFISLKAFASDNQVDVLWGKYHIHIINDLPDNWPPLTVHCKDKNKDLGARSLKKHEEYFFVTNIDFFRKRLFFCFAQSGQKQRWFDAFKAKRDEDRCRHKKYCMWSAMQGGIHFSNDNFTWVLEYPW